VGFHSQLINQNGISIVDSCAELSISFSRNIDKAVYTDILIRIPRKVLVNFQRLITTPYTQNKGQD